MTAQPTLTLTETGNLRIHIPMRIRRMRGRKMIFAPQALDGGVPDSPSEVQGAVVQALGRAFSWSGAIENGEFSSVAESGEASRHRQLLRGAYPEADHAGPRHHRSDPQRRRTLRPVARPTDPHLPPGLGAAENPVRVHLRLSRHLLSRTVRALPPLPASLTGAASARCGRSSSPGRASSSPRRIGWTSSPRPLPLSNRFDSLFRASYIVCLTSEYSR